MANFRGYGYLTTLTPEQQKADIIEYLIAAEGKISVAAFNMGYGRFWIYIMIDRHRLWPLVNKLRLDRIERQKLEKKHGLSSQRSSKG